MDSILEIQNLSKRYGDHVAVDDISFSVPRGSVFGLLGPNGAGKTTTIRMIMRIIAIDSAGNIRWSHNSPTMYRASESAVTAREIGID